ncbi:hypothetical protein CASFOL_017007 [Castilleja foliolosa]|uniref:SWIRM domain-containing protein n=1 Tax=Castilleja foliolosa TaxID=1961234 RepID=A0ABD3DE04_9LAMI
MDEEKKMILKRKLKPIETSVGSDDDEPLGALLKLKGKRTSKKSKVLASGVGNKVKGAKKVLIEDDEMVGMDDTLAIFRKKLRAPKKNVGSAIAAEKELSSIMVEPLCLSVDESVTDSELDPNGVSRANKRCLGSTEGGYFGDASVMEGLKPKAKMKNKRSKVKSDTNKTGTSESDSCFDRNASENDALNLENEGALESKGVELEDSLSTFFQKMSGKSSIALRVKQEKETQVSDDGSKPSSGAGSDAPVWKSESIVPDDDDRHAAPGQGSIKSTLIIQRVADCSPEVLTCTLENPFDSNKGISVDGSSGEVILENSASTCFFKDVGVVDAKFNYDPINETPDTNNILGTEPKDLGTSLCEDRENICDDVKLNSRLIIDVDTSFSAQVQKEHPSGDHDGFVKETSQEEDNQVAECKSSHVSANEDLTDEVVLLLRKHNFEPDKVDIEPEHVSESPNIDYLSEDEEANNGTSNASNLLDHQGRGVEGKGSLADPETKESSLSIGLRAVRKAKKHRHGDMAYEGDGDWEVLMQAPEYFVNHQSLDKTKAKFNSLPVDGHSGNGKVAAVAAGLKARAAGPLEKLKFKEVLKRKGGLQEYLECRNHILSVWNKNVNQILQLADFGVSETPLVVESPRASLIRDIFSFLDQCGYINFGVPSKKEVEKCIKHDVKLLTEKLEDTSVLPVADSEDGDYFILGKEKNLETCIRNKDDDAFAEETQAGKVIKEHGISNLEALESSAPCVPDVDSRDDIQIISSLEPLPLEEPAVSECLTSTHSCKNENGTTIAAVQPDLLTPDEAICDEHTKSPNLISGNLPDSTDCAYIPTQYDLRPKKNIIVVGAGPAGLAAASHLQRQGFTVTVLEARSRIGGRVFTDRSSLSVPVDLGASIITGVEADVATERRPDPSSLVCAQLGLELTVLNSDCPLYDTVTGQKVPADLDEELEAEYNGLLDDMELLVAEKGERVMKMSLEEGLEYGLKRRRMAHSERDYSETIDDEKEGLSPLERRVMDWHFAHLEYGCAALLEEVSLPNWNQDDVYGGFGGAHCMIKGGYSAVVESLAEGICIQLDNVVTDITYLTKDCETVDRLNKKVKVSTSNGKEFSGDAVLVTVPLGCLKAESIKFSPPLPQWKYLSIKRLGFGVLNKVVLEFPEVFWDDTIDYFGATAEDRDQRGRCFMFWNVKKTVGAPVLIALVVGKAAKDGRDTSSSDNVSHALLVLRKLFGKDKVADPVAAVVTDWGRDPYSYGAYSYVAVGSSGEDYDILGRPVENCLFFAGEATCKEHPDTVGGAMMSGLREAIRIIDLMNTGTDYIAEVEAMEAARRHLDIERSEVKDIIRKLDAVEFSSALYKKSLDGSHTSSRVSMLKDMFFAAKTTAGRLRLAKELLKIPVGFLKTFASTKEGLSTLNSWILDSMGKDGTQLLRHCVRLLVLVSNDLAAVRLSGVGKTVKQKVCVHTSRDIRAIAFQLVRVWVELFRKEKASKGGLKLLRQSSTLVSGKPPLLKGGLSTKKVVDDPVKSETRTDPKPEVHLSNAMEEDDHEIHISEEEKAAFAAAESAHAAAIAAAKALAASGARHNASRQAPKILSFHKFAMRGQPTHMDEPGIRKNWSGAAIGKQDCLSEIDSRNCRVRDWSVDFSATGVNPESSKISVDNRSHRNRSNENANHNLDNIREHSGESVAVDNTILTKAWVDSVGSVGMKDYSAIERWQCQAAAASSAFSHEMPLTDEEDSNRSSRKHESRANESSASQITINKVSKGSQSKGADRLKKAVVDYVASLLMPLYNAKKIERDSYKLIMKKAATKVMEQTTDAEKAMAVFEFLDFKRKNKIRAFVDVLIERHKAVKPDAKSGTSEKN